MKQRAERGNERERQQHEREAKLQKVRETERERLQRDREAKLQKERENERQREAPLQQEREKQQCDQCERLKRKQETDDELSKKVVEDLKSQVETLKCELVSSIKEVCTLKRQIDESEKEHVAWKKQFWKLNDKYETLLNKNKEMHGEVPEAETQRDTKRQCKAQCRCGAQREDEVHQKTDKCECMATLHELLKKSVEEVRHLTIVWDGPEDTYYSVIDFMEIVCSQKTSEAVYKNWEYFRDRSAYKEEIKKFTRKLASGPVARTPLANISGLGRMLQILGKKHVDIKFHSLVDEAYMV